MAEPMSAFADRRFIARAGIALMLANARYWSSVAPLVRAQLRGWRRSASEIEDPTLRALALENLREEGHTAEAAAMLATLAPRSQRRRVVRAIVALEVMYDYLDGVNERPAVDPLKEGERLFEPFIEAICAGAGGGRLGEGGSTRGDSGYLRELSGTVAGAVAELPSRSAIDELARVSARRSAEAQIRMHAAPHEGDGQLQAWAKSAAQGGELEWRELLAGAASSVICLHALIAAAADRRTSPDRAAQIENVYLAVSAIGTLLDSLIDYEADLRSGGLAFIEHYERPDLLGCALASLAADAAAKARALPDGPHHTIVLVGVVAYFTSAAGARAELAEPIVAELHAQLRPLIGPTLAMMRAWRAVKRARSRLGASARGKHTAQAEPEAERLEA
jgi:tetraprenyl-beta-curcumene synthase